VSISGARALQNTYEVLRDEKPVVKVQEELRLRALKLI
jgi:hypothetical protein